MDFIVFVLILSLLVLIHEFGHFAVAKLCKMRVEEFGIGLPPKIKKLFSWGGTEFSLNWLPIGGFVKLYGEDFEDATQVASKEAFFNKPILQRAAVLLAGVTMNFILGVVLFGTVYTIIGIPTKVEKVIVTEVRPGSPAEKAGVVAERVIEKMVVGKQEFSFKNPDEFVKAVADFKGKEIELTTEFKGVKSSLKMTPRENPPVGEGALGVALSDMEMKQYPLWQMPFRGVKVGLGEAISWGKMIAENLGTLVMTIVSGKGIPKDVSGPIGIYQLSKQVYKIGFIAILQFMGVLSINLAILNIMPFPALDGGRLVFLVIEKIIGKKLKNKIEGIVHSGGMIFLLGVMVLITVRDVWRLFIK